MFKSWPGVPLIQPLAPVRACVFFLFLGLFEALGDVGRGRGLFGWVCSRYMVLQIFLAGIPLFWAVTPIRARIFWIFEGIVGSGGYWGEAGSCLIWPDGEVGVG